MKIDTMARNFYYDGENKVMSITIKFTDGSVKTLDLDEDQVKGMSLWLLVQHSLLADEDPSKLERLPFADEYRIVSRCGQIPL